MDVSLARVLVVCVHGSAVSWLHMIELEHVAASALRLGVSLQACLLQIVGYRNLIAEVEKLRREPYDSENPQHEEMLLKVSVRRCLEGSLYSCQLPSLLHDPL